MLQYSNASLLVQFCFWPAESEIQYCFTTVSVKMVGTLWGLLSHQCWCTRFGDQTAINNFERDERSTRREKNSVWLKCPNYFCLRLYRGGI